MKKEDLNIAKKAVIIAQNIARADEEAIGEFVSSDMELSEKLSARLNDDKRAEFLLDKLAESNKNKDFVKLVKEIEAIKRRRTRRLFVRVGASVAAIFIVAFFVWNQGQKIVVDTTAGKQVNQVPILITDGGSRINLEDLTGTISEDNYKIEKKGTNMISYSKSTDSVKKVEAPKYNEVKIPSKYMYTIKLEDGTQVTLNAGSSLRYPTEFSGSERRVELKGEAYFSVAKSDKPFIVKINDMNVQVYGTLFNIKTLSSGIIETVLVEGSIGIFIKEKKEVLMQPNQLLVYDERNSIIELSSINASRYIHWLDNNFKYFDVALVDVINDLSQWYGIDFKVNSKIDSIKITLFSSRDCELKEMLEFIESLTDVKFVKEGGRRYDIYR